MTRSIIEATAQLARLRGVDLAPDWDRALAEAGDLTGPDAAEALARRLGWKATARKGRILRYRF